jgi:hypothetical protein
VEFVSISTPSPKQLCQFVHFRSFHQLGVGIKMLEAGAGHCEHNQLVGLMGRQMGQTEMEICIGGL